MRTNAPPYIEVLQVVQLFELHNVVLLVLHELAIQHFTMLLEDQRFLHEDLERLEQAITDRVAEDPRNVSAISPPP
jgi:ABC-type phosphonate transport system ATPase subunit